MDYTFGVIRDLHTDLSEFANTFGTYVDVCQTKTDDLKGVKEKVERYDNMSVEDYYVEAMIEALKDSAEYKDKKNARRRGGMVSAERARLRGEASFDSLSDAEKQRFISELETKRTTSHSALATIDVQKAELEVRGVKVSLVQNIANLREVNVDTVRSITSSISALDDEVRRVNERYAKLQAVKPAAEFAGLDAKRKEEVDKLTARREFFVQARSLFDNLMQEIENIEVRNANVEDNFAIQLDESLEAIKIITDGLDVLNQQNENSQVSVNEMTDSIKGLNDKLLGLNQEVFRVDIVTVGDKFQVVARYDGRKATSQLMSADELTKEAIDKHCMDFGKQIVGLKYIDEIYNADFIIRKDGVILGDLNDQTKGKVGYDGYADLAVAAIAGLAVAAQTVEPVQTAEPVQVTPAAPVGGGEDATAEETVEEDKTNEDTVAPAGTGEDEAGQGSETEEEDLDENLGDTQVVGGPVEGAAEDASEEGTVEGQTEEEDLGEDLGDTQVVGGPVEGAAEGAAEGENASLDEEDEDLDLTGVGVVTPASAGTQNTQEKEKDVTDPAQRASIKKTDDRLKVTNARLAKRATKLAASTIGAAALFGVAALTSGPLMTIAAIGAGAYAGIQGLDALRDVVGSNLKRVAARRKIGKIAKDAGFEVEYRENGEVHLYVEEGGQRDYLGFEDADKIRPINELLAEAFHNDRRGTGKRSDVLGNLTPVTVDNLAAAFENCGGHGKTDSEVFAHSRKTSEKVADDAKKVGGFFKGIGDKIGGLFSRDDDEYLDAEYDELDENENENENEEELEDIAGLAAAAGVVVEEQPETQEEAQAQQLDEDVEGLAAAAGVVVEEPVNVQTNSGVVGVGSDFFLEDDEEDLVFGQGVDQKLAAKQQEQVYSQEEGTSLGM